MKQIYQLASIKNKSNRLISVGDSDWSFFRKGTEIRFQNENELYCVIDSSKFMAIKDFSAVNQNTLKIAGNSDLEFSEGDTVKVTYKKYGISNVFKISNPGNGYKAGDILFVVSDCYEKNPITNEDYLCRIKVEKVSDRGEILSVSILEQGNFISEPNDILVVGGGSGKGSTMHFSKFLYDNRNIEERSIKSINNISNACLINLEYPINKSISSGKISIEKWEARISTEYLGETKINKQFQLYRDYTANFGLHLMAPNSPSAHICYNSAMKKIDQKLKDIEDQIKKYTNLINK